MEDAAVEPVTTVLSMPLEGKHCIVRDSRVEGRSTVYIPVASAELVGVVEIEVAEDNAGELVFLERVDNVVEEKEEVPVETDIVKALETVQNEVHLVGWLEVVHDNRVVKEVAPGDSVSLVARVGGHGAEQATLGECREEGGRQLTPHCGQV